MSLGYDLPTLKDPNAAEVALYIGFADVLHEELPEIIPKPDVSLLCAQYGFPVYAKPIIEYLSHVTKAMVSEIPEDTGNFYLDIMREKEESGYYSGFRDSYKLCMNLFKDRDEKETGKSREKILEEFRTVRSLFHDKERKNMMPLFSMAQDVKNLKCLSLD